MKFKDTPITQRYSKGDVIISEGIVSNNAYIVLEGKVQVTKKVDRKMVVINTLRKDDVFGEMGLITPSIRSANVTAMEDVTIGIIDKDQFHEYLDSIPGEMQTVMKTLVERLRFTTEQLSRLGIELDKTKQSLQTFSLKQK
jgi:CRP-like cAMP-binding protein